MGRRSVVDAIDVKEEVVDHCEMCANSKERRAHRMGRCLDGAAAAWQKAAEGERERYGRGCHGHGC